MWPLGEEFNHRIWLAVLNRELEETLVFGGGEVTPADYGFLEDSGDPFLPFPASLVEVAVEKYQFVTAESDLPPPAGEAVLLDSRVGKLEHALADIQSSLKTLLVGRS